MSRRTSRSVVAVLSGGLGLSLAACGSRTGTEPPLGNPPPVVDDGGGQKAAPEVPAVLTKRGDSTVEETTERARETAEKAARGAQQQVDERKRATAAAIAKTAEAQREGERLTREQQAVARRLQEADGRGPVAGGVG